jgi:hypothetical protein
VLPPNGKKVSKGCGAAWCVALEIGTGKRSPLSVTRTDVQQITKMVVERRIGGKVGPPIRSMDTRIRQARAEAQHQEPFIRPMTSQGWRDVATRRGVKAHETLLIPFGAQQAKRVCSEMDPKGHQYLPMGTGGFLMVSTQTWDALLLPNPRPSCLKTDGDRYRNLAPFVQFVEEPGTGSCVWIHTERGFSVLVAKEDLEEGVLLRAEECVLGGEGIDSPASTDEEDVEGEDSDSEDQDPKYQEEEPDDDAALSEEDHDDPGEEKGEGGSEKPPKAKVGKPAWSARPYRAKQWVDVLKLRLGEEGMWCYLKKKGNLNLCTINVNGNPMGRLFQVLLNELVTGKDCPIDGIVLVDTRTPEDQVGFQSRA